MRTRPSWSNVAVCEYRAVAIEPVWLKPAIGEAAVGAAAAVGVGPGVEVRAAVGVGSAVPMVIGEAVGDTAG
jgi:hypothetical protein